MNRDGSTPAPASPRDFGSAAGSVTRSNPPIPLFIDDGQAPPEAYGVTSYTTRPPWMTDNASTPDISGTTKSYVVDGASLAPFEPGAVAVPKTMAAAGVAAVGTVAPALSAVPFAAPAATSVAADTAPAVGLPYAGSRGVGSGLFALGVRFLVLGVKLLPLAGVMVGGYYTYTYYFGPVPIVQRLLHPGAAPVPPPKSKVAVMMDMTRDVVAKNNRRIDFANELANEGVDLDTLKDPAAARKPAATGAMVSAPVAVTVAAPASPAAGPAVASRNAPLDAGPSETLAVGGTNGISVAIANQSAVVLSGESDPSPEFIDWVKRIDVGGVRSGRDPRAIIDGVTRDAHDVANFGLKIEFVGVDETQKLLIFRDDSGARVGKRYY